MAAALAGWPLLMGAAEVTNVLVTAVRPAKTSVFLRASWPTEDSLPTHSVEVFAKGDLNAASWTRVGTGKVYERDSDIEVPQSAWPEEWKSVFFVLGLALDTDGDGLSDSFERFVSKTDVAKSDSDGDGMPDGWEFDCGFDPLSDDASGDRDGDGLANGFEYAQGTDPGNADTDGDGLGDGTETGRLSVGAGDAVPWFELEDGASVVAAADQTSGLYAFDLPFETSLAGDRVDRVVADVHGVVCFGTESTTANVKSGGAHSLATPVGPDCCRVAGYWSVLKMRTAKPSRIRAGTVTIEDVRHFVIEYDRFGTIDEAGDEISFQISLAEDAPDVVRVRYGTVAVSQTGWPVSVGAQGGLGVPALSHYYATVPPTIAAGTVLVYGFGCGGDPLDVDTDGDGLDDAEEVALGSCPKRADTDFDGLPDVWEVRYGLDPASDAGSDGAEGDPDGDGVSNAREYEYGSDPTKTDTDGDEIADGDEVGYIAVENPLPWLAFDEDASDDLTLELLAAQKPFGSCSVTRALPKTLSIQGVYVDTITLTTKGWLFLNREGYENPGYARGDDDLSGDVDANTLALQVYGCDQLVVSTNLVDRPTRVRLGTSTYDGTQYLLVEYENMYLGEPGRETNSISWQVALPIGEAPAPAAAPALAAATPCGVTAFGDVPRGYVRYRDACGQLRTRKYGSVGMQAMGGKKRVKLHNGRWVMAYDGMGLTFYFGTNSDPSEIDSDGDGLSDAREYELGTNPRSSDTDNDGMPDAWEVANGLRPNRKSLDGFDSDGDGLSDRDEYELGSNPHAADTDGDGLSDYIESVDYGTNPSDADTDDDGIADNDEIMKYGTDPLNADTDGDGMTDGWEVDNDLSPSSAYGVNGAKGDPDGEGLKNIDEYLNNCNPHVKDTDNDGTNDFVEVMNGTDPTRAEDGESVPVDLFRSVKFTLDGDWAAWEMTIRGTNTLDQRTRKVSMLRAGCSTNVVLKMRKGAAYELSVRWLNCGDHKDECAPWYCWGVQIDDRPWVNTFASYSNKRLPGNEIILGPGWIAENASGLLTGHICECAKEYNKDLDRYVASCGNVAGKLKATLYILGDPTVTPDYDRDRQITAAEVKRSTGTDARFNFWVNDDRDHGDVNDSDHDQPGRRSKDKDDEEPACTILNCEDSVVNGRGDLLDFTPVLLDIRPIYPQGIPTDLKNYLDTNLVWSLWSDSVSAVFTGLAAENAGKFHFEEDKLFGEGLRQNAHEATVVDLRSGSEFPLEFLQSLYAHNGQGVIAVEGRSQGETLMLVANSRDGVKDVVERSLDFVVHEVSDFYGTANIRDAKADGNYVPVKPEIICPPRKVDLVDRDLIHIHGFNVSKDNAKSWFAELYKRLWQSGMNGRFWFVTWYGDYNILGSAFNFMHYIRNVEWGLTSIDAYIKLVEAIQPDASKRVLMAHSLGNMVASEALRIAAENHKVWADQYFMMNAAVASEAYDGTMHEAEGMIVRYVPDDWKPYPRESWAANWHEWFPDDDRGKLRWKNYFSGVPNAVKDVFCYYSSGDEVFAEYKDDKGNIATPTLASGIFHLPTFNIWPPEIDFSTLDWPTPSVCAWQKSEIGKGLEPIAGSMHGGWGFHCWTETIGQGLGMTTTVKYYSVAEATKLCEQKMIPNRPVFARNQNTMFQPTLTQPEINHILAYCIPAVSSATGLVGVRNLETCYDINVGGGQSYKNKWGRSGDDTNWLHSDWKDMAYYYVYKLFDEIVKSKGLLDKKGK